MQKVQGPFARFQRADFFAVQIHHPIENLLKAMNSFGIFADAGGIESIRQMLRCKTVQCRPIGRADPGNIGMPDQRGDGVIAWWLIGIMVQIIGDQPQKLEGGRIGRWPALRPARFKLLGLQRLAQPRQRGCIRNRDGDLIHRNSGGAPALDDPRDAQRLVSIALGQVNLPRIQPCTSVLPMVGP